MRSNTSNRKSSNKKDKRERNQAAPVRATVVADASFLAHLEKLQRVLRNQHPAQQLPVLASIAPNPSAAPLSAAPVTRTNTIEPVPPGVSMLQMLDAMRAMSLDDKHVDSAAHFACAPSGTIVDVLGNISQGITYDQRTGDYIRLRRFVLNYEVRYNLAAGSPLGVLVVVGKNHDGAPNAGQVFTMAAGTTEANSLSLLPKTSEMDVRWIKFKHHDSTPNLSNVKGEIIINPQWLVQFSPASTTVTEGDLFFGVICDNAAGTYPEFWYNFRLEYTDSDA